MTASLSKLLAKPWIWSYIGALLVWLAAIFFTRGYGAGGMVTAALSLAVFMVVVGVGQMFVISLGPGNVDLSLPANIGLASAVAMKVTAGDDGLVAIGLLAALFCGLSIGTVNYLLIWALRIPPIIATLSASFYHPVDRHRFWSWPSDQAADRLCGFHQYPDPRHSASRHPHRAFHRRR
jgi:ribose transport system permease protein